jgi:hypothetical protein
VQLADADADRTQGATCNREISAGGALAARKGAGKGLGLARGTIDAARAAVGTIDGPHDVATRGAGTALGDTWCSGAANGARRAACRR